MNFQQILQMATQNPQPQQFLQQNLGNHPAYQRMQTMIQNKSPQDIQQLVANLCREQGTTPEQLMQNLGIQNQQQQQQQFSQNQNFRR